MIELISIEQSVPDRLVEVIAETTDGNMVFAYYDDGMWFNDDTGEIIGYVDFDCGVVVRADGVTRWMPLPEHTKEDDK